MQKVLEEAYEDWRNGTDESDKTPTSKLADIFRDCGWNKNGITYTASGKVSDWCGMAVDAWLLRAGMNSGHRKSFYHTMNVEDFATYGKPKDRKYPFNSKRLITEVKVNNQWIKLEDWHKQNNASRLWIDEQTIRNTPLDKLDIRPGDIILFDYQGSLDKLDDENSDEADHITMCASYNIIGNGILETIEGNASGLDINGNKKTDSVVVVKRNLNENFQRKRIYGIARVSPLDFDLTHELR